MKWKMVGVVLVLCAVGACVWAVQSQKSELVFRGMRWGIRLKSWGRRGSSYGAPHR